MASEGVKYMGKVLLQQEEGLSWDSRAFWEYRSFPLQPLALKTIGKRF